MNDEARLPADATRIAEVVRRRVDDGAQGLHAFWLEIQGDRDSYAELIRLETADVPVITLVVRGVRFDNANALVTDFISLLNANREECEQKLSAAEVEGPPTFLLLARTALPVVQLASPATAPDWLPGFGGCTVHVAIEDLTWTADAPINASEARIQEISERLFDLEEVIARRLLLVRAASPEMVNSFLDQSRRNANETFETIAASSEQLRRETRAASGFRPSLRNAGSWVARLWDLSQRKAPGALTHVTRGLAGALAVPPSLGLQWHESYLAVLARPAERDASECHRFARNLIVTVGCACQLVTAAAHADAYSRYPVPLLRSLSYDIRRALDSAESVIATTDIEVGR